MQFNYGNSSNYLAGGKGLSDITNALYKTNLDTGFNVSETVLNNARNRNALTLNAMKNNSQMQKNLFVADANKKVKKSINKAEKDIQNIKNSTRMTGVLAVGLDTKTKYDYLKKFQDENQKDANELKTGRDDLLKSLEASDAKRDALTKKISELYKQRTNPISTNETGSSTSTSSGTLPLTSNVTPITSTGGDMNRQEVYNYLTKDKNLSKNKALGLMANIERESSFRANPAGGDGGNSFGSLQWNNTYGRADIMKKNVPDFATNWKGQLDHALSQNQLPEYNAVAKEFLNTKFDSPQAASEYFLRNWEKPQDTQGGIQKNNQFIAGYNFG